MTKKQERVDHFIRLIRGISPQYLRYACTHGACYRFFLILQDRFPSAVPYRTVCDGGGHVVAKIEDMYWDIWGEHDPKEHGKVRKFCKETWRHMSSCYFEEGYVLQNAHTVVEYDKKA